MEETAITIDRDDGICFYLHGEEVVAQVTCFAWTCVFGRLQPILGNIVAVFAIIAAITISMFVRRT